MIAIANSVTTTAALFGTTSGTSFRATPWAERLRALTSTTFAAGQARERSASAAAPSLAR
jgi:hypothetical protein